MPLFDDPDEEIRELEVRAATPRRQVDPGASALAKVWARDAPWMSPRAVALLAQNKVDPTSPAGRRISVAGVKVRTKRGLGFHSVGDAVKAVVDVPSNVADFVLPEGVEDAIGGTVGQVQRGVKGVTRTAGLAAMAPIEAVQGVVRGAAGFAGQAAEGMQGGIGGRQATAQNGIFQQADTVFDQTVGQTTLGAGLESGDYGEGFFPGGTAVERQAENARNLASINGHAVTPGRLLASAVVEPGSKPYTVLSGLVDLSVAIYADPSNVALKGVGKANKARKLFDAGAVEGSRKGVLAEQVDGWLSSPAGRKVVNFLTDQGDFDTIWKRTDGKLGAKVSVELADAKTEQDVLAILKPLLGVEVLEKPTIGRLPSVQKRMDRVRLLGDMPGNHIDPNDIDDAVRQVDAFQLNAKLDPQVRAANNRLMAEASTPAEVYDVVINHVLKDVGGQVGRKYAKAWSNYHNEFAKYFVDEIGENASIPGAVIDGAGKPLPTPHLFVEYLNGSIPLPDARAIRRATSTTGRIIDTVPGLDFGVALGDFFMGQMWKPMVLLRGAWTVRVVGEEQIRMAASGNASLFSHPLSFIAMAIGDKPRSLEGLTRRGKVAASIVNAMEAPARAVGRAGKGRTGITGDVLRESDEGLAAMSKGTGGFRGGDVIATKYKTVYERGNEFFSRGWADELAQLHSDPIARRLVAGLGEGDRVPGGITGNTLDDVKRWFSEGAGRKFRDDLSAARPELANRADADAYIDSVLKRIQIKSGDDQRLLDVIASGKLNGRALPEPGRADKRLYEMLDEIADEDAAMEIFPRKVKGDLMVATKGTPGSKAGDRWNMGVEALFNGLMSKPTNYLSRSPAFQQFYWQRVQTLIPSMDEAAQATALANAEKSGLAKDALDALRKAAKVGTGRLDLDDADLIAKGFGLDETRKLLYDLHQRSQFFDITRLIFPFGEAWKELTTTWAKIGYQNPNTLRRVQQGVQGARGAGFFYENENGEEVFAYPGTAFLNEKLLGAPVPFTGRAQGLSVMTEVIPGFGPVVQMAAGSLLPETPSWDGVREILMPFGEKDPEAGFIESQLPAWLQKLRTSGYLRDVPFMGPNPEQERMLNNTAFDLLAYEVSAGKRPRPSTIEEIQAAVEENMEKARFLYLIRAGAQFVAPTAPAPEHVAADKNGNLMVAQRMRDDLYKSQEKHGYDEGWDRWLEKYGEAAFLVTQSKSTSLVYGAPVTADGVKWERENPDVVKAFPDVYGFFAPATGEFDFQAYARQFRTGTREGLTPTQAVMLANNRIASTIYDEQRKRVGPNATEEARTWLRDLKSALVEEYPGFTDIPGIATKAKRDTAINQLKDAVENPTVAATDAGQGLIKYLAARKKAEEAGKTPTSFRGTKGLRPVRDWLRTFADAVRTEHPAFTPLWEQVFERELTEDTED